MSRTQIAKTVNNLISPPRSKQSIINYSGGSSFVLSNLRAWRLIVPLLLDPLSDSITGKKKKEPLLQLSITPRTIAAFRCAIMVDLVKLYSSALEDNKTSIRREGIIERRRRSVSSSIPRIQTEFPLYFPLLLYPLLVE